EHDAGLRVVLEPRHRDDHHVVADGKKPQCVLASLVGHRAPRVLRADVRRGNGRTWNDGTLRVLDAAENRSGGRLCAHRRRDEQQEKGTDDGSQYHYGFLFGPDSIYRGLPDPPRPPARPMFEIDVAGARATAEPGTTTLDAAPRSGGSGAIERGRTTGDTLL